MEEISHPQKWHELKNKLKQKYPHLTDADLCLQEGKEDEMVRIVQYKLRKTKQEMHEIIKRL